MKRTPRDPIGQKALHNPVIEAGCIVGYLKGGNIVQYLGPGHPADATEGRKEYPPKRIHFRKMPM